MPNDSSVYSKKAQVPTVTVTNSTYAVYFSQVRYIKQTNKKSKSIGWNPPRNHLLSVSPYLIDDAVVYLLISFVTLFPSVNLGP